MLNDGGDDNDDDDDDDDDKDDGDGDDVVDLIKYFQCFHFVELKHVRRRLCVPFRKRVPKCHTAWNLYRRKR